MRLNSISSDVSPGGWATAGVLIRAVLANDRKLFKDTMSVPTRWEHEALSTLAAAAITELAGHTQETPEATLARMVTSLSAKRHAPKTPLTPGPGRRMSPTAALAGGRRVGDDARI